MANIQTVITKRHDWREQLLFNPSHPKSNERGHVRGLLCLNCRKAVYPDMTGSPALAGCLSDIKVQNVGRARQNDYLEQEMRLREQEERPDSLARQPIEMPKVSRRDFERMKELAAQLEG